MTDKEERIGKVRLDYKHYPGEDLYCDGKIEEELLTIARDRAESEYPAIIAERRSWPVLYHLSAQRENIVDWLPLDGSEKVLEIGSGCGAVTGILGKKAGSVTCVDLSRQRSRINAYRHQELGNVTIHVGNFQNIEPELPCDYDVICLIGVFEYGRGYIGGDTPYEDFLKIVLRHRKPGGRIIIAIENKYGMKYWAGCAEDHVGKYFAGVENYKEKSSARTFSKKGLERIFKKCGIEEYSFYYPYPDYKFMTTLYSDEILPVQGELSNNLRNFDGERLILFDERDAFDGVLEEGMFPEFSNSFLVVLGPDYPVRYAKFSNDRAREFAIRTEIVEVPGCGGDSVLAVRKYPLTDEAKQHIRSIEASYHKLRTRFGRKNECGDEHTGNRFAINRCHLLPETGRLEEPVAELEYITGVTLSEKLDECLEREDMEGFRRLFDRYMELLQIGAEQPISDYDLIFPNVLINGDAWTVIDYEWTFDKAIEPKAIAFRALYCYILENDKRNKLNLDSILSELDISKEEIEDYQEKEKEFQRYVTGRQKSMFELYDSMHGLNITLTEMYRRHIRLYQKAVVQIFEDRGRGFNQEDSYFLYLTELERGSIELHIRTDGNVRALRLDPAEERCMVQIKTALWNGTPFRLSGKEAQVESNGRMLTMPRRKGVAEENAPCIVFDTDDPNIIFYLDGMRILGENELEIKLDFVPLTESMAAYIGQGNGISKWLSGIHYSKPGK